MRLSHMCHIVEACPNARTFHKAQARPAAYVYLMYTSLKRCTSRMGMPKHTDTHTDTPTHTHTRTTNRHTASPGTRHPAYASDIQSSMNQHHAAPGIRHPAPDIRHPAPGAQHPAPSNNEGLICFRVLPPDSCFNAGLFGHQQACIAICSHANPRRWRR